MKRKNSESGEAGSAGSEIDGQAGSLSQGSETSDSAAVESRPVAGVPRRRKKLNESEVSPHVTSPLKNKRPASKAAEGGDAVGGAASTADMKSKKPSKAATSSTITNMGPPIGGLGSPSFSGLSAQGKPAKRNKSAKAAIAAATAGAAVTVTKTTRPTFSGLTPEMHQLVLGDSPALPSFGTPAGKNFGIGFGRTPNCTLFPLFIISRVSE
jgi:hypothetical protein